TMITAPNSRRGRLHTGVLEGDGFVFYKIPRMHLTPGTYHITAGVYDENNLHVFDQREREFELRVQPGSANDGEGYLDLGGEWALPADEAEAHGGGGHPAALPFVPQPQLVARLRERNPLPDGTLTVGAGLVVNGIMAYAFLGLAG